MKYIYAELDPTFIPKEIDPTDASEMRAVLAPHSEEEYYLELFNNQCIPCNYTVKEAGEGIGVVMEKI